MMHRMMLLTWVSVKEALLRSMVHSRCLRGQNATNAPMTTSTRLDVKSVLISLLALEEELVSLTVRAH